MKNAVHQIVLQAKSGEEWLDIDTFATNNRYMPTKEQLRQINALKYEIQTETRIIRRKEIVK